MPKLFAISDHHFGHQNIIKYCHRKDLDGNPLSSALEDAKLMIEAHNKVVCDDDLVVFVGDVQVSKQGGIWIPKILPKLKGRKILIRGNHDHKTDQEYLDMGFERVDTTLVIDEYCFHHYPDTLAVIDLCQSQNKTLVCGHTHKPFKNYTDGVKRLNVCVDVMGRTPLFLKDF